MEISRKFCKFLRILPCLALTLLLLPSAAKGEGETVRVLLSVGSNKSFTLTLTGDYLCQEQTLSGGTLTCSVAQKGVRLSHSEAGQLKSQEEIVISPVNENSYFTVKTRYYGTRNYSGELRLSRTPKGNVRVVNAIPVEDYQYGVLLGELEADAPKEGMKALAVAARGLALNAMGSEERYDITDAGDNPDFVGAGGEREETLWAAVCQVAGQTLIYHNQPVNTYYCRANGGRTLLPQHVWKVEADPAFAPLYDPADLTGDPGAKTALVTGNPADLPPAVAAFFLEQVRQVLPKADEIIAIASFTEGAPEAEADWACPVALQLTALTDGAAQPLTLAFDLTELAAPMGAENYDLCYVQQEARGALIVFSTTEGHRVGLSRRGLLTMAEDGYGYREILSFYYPGTRLDGPPEASPEAVPATPVPQPDGTEAAASQIPRLMGDVNEDGALTREDAILLTKRVLGLATFSHSQHGVSDINGNGSVNLADALALWKQLDGPAA